MLGSRVRVCMLALWLPFWEKVRDICVRLRHGQRVFDSVLCEHLCLHATFQYSKSHLDKRNVFSTYGYITNTRFFEDFKKILRNKHSISNTCRYSENAFLGHL